MNTAVMTATSTGRPTADLVAAARQHDSAAYEELIRRYESCVWATVRRYRLSDADAHDVVQVTWLRLVENLDRVRSPDHLGGWLATTASRECLRLLRGRGREIQVAEERLVDHPDDRCPDPEKQTVDNSMAVLLWEQVNSLPARGRTLLRALTCHDAPAYAELSTLIEMPVGSIGPTRGRYLKRLREDLERAGLGADAWR